MKKHALTAFALSALTLALTACGGGGSSSGGETRSTTPVVTSGSTTTTTTAGTTTTTTSTAAKTAMNFVTDYKGNNELRMTKPTGKLATELQNVLAATNKLRAEKGLSPLVLDENLSAYAQLRANDTVSLFEHARPNGQAWHLGVIGVVGENLAAGTASDTGAEAVEQWKNSPAHYAAIINGSYTKVGLGVVYVPNSEYGYYWVQIFGNDSTQSPYSFVDNSVSSNAAPLSTVIVNGVSIPANIVKQGTWNTFDYQVKNDDGTVTNKYNGWVNGYANSRFGAVKYTIADNTNVFYQGLQTAESAMPTTGTATYNGQALIVKNGTVDTNVQSQFNANFANKTLTGTLKQNGSTLYNLNANISGSSFASSTGATVQTQGAFFGDKAEELGGTFNDTATGTTGAYGATK